MRLRRQAAVLVLAITLAAPWTATAEPRLDRDGTERPVVSVSEFLSHAWSLFTSLWEAVSACDEGFGADPLGCPAQPTSDAGLGMDPLGSPAQPTIDEGLGMDPLG